MSIFRKIGNIFKKDKAKFISSFDPNGSYTGSPVENNEKPVQDADDL